MELTSDPPQEALNGGLGISFVVLLPADGRTPEGVLVEDAFERLGCDAVDIRIAPLEQIEFANWT